MKRREFMKMSGFMTASVATLGLTACFSSSDSGTPAVPVSFPQGVASGDPHPDSVVLWTRAEPVGSQTSFSIVVQVSATSDFRSLLVNQTISVASEWDYTVRHKVTGLSPSNTYYYRFVQTDGAGSSTVGRTKTAPAAGSSVTQLKFAFIACQDWSVNHWGAFDELVNEDLDFVVHLGDYIYETVGATFQTGNVESRHAQLKLPNGTARADGAMYATTLADYRYLYKSYRKDARLQALHARFPMIAIWDDHEFSDDCWQDRQNYTATDGAQPNTARRRSANQAWFEFMPADVPFSASNAAFDNIKIYRSFSFGSLATLVMTDQRLYRADHIVDEAILGGEIGTRYFVPKGFLETFEANKIAAANGQLTPVSVLGDTQRTWFKDQMKAATSTWKLWGNETSLLRMGADTVKGIGTVMAAALVQSTPTLSASKGAIATAIAQDIAAAMSGATYPTLAYSNLTAVLSSQGGISGATFAATIKPAMDALLPPSFLLGNFILNADQWDGYNAERKNLMAHFKSNGITNVAALTGDIHAFFSGAVWDDFDAASPSPVMVDLVTAGVSSNSLFSYFKAAVDTNPLLGSAKALVYDTKNGAVVNNFDALINTFNGDWIKYIDTDAQGYAVVTLTPAKLSCVFHKLNGLAGTSAPTVVTASSKTVEIAAGSLALSVH